MNRDDGAANWATYGNQKSVLMKTSALRWTWVSWLTPWSSSSSCFRQWRRSFGGLKTCLYPIHSVKPPKETICMLIYKQTMLVKIKIFACGENQLPWIAVPRLLLLATKHKNSTPGSTNLLAASKLVFRKSLNGLMCNSLVKRTWLAMFCMILHISVKPRLMRGDGWTSTIPDSHGDTDRRTTTHVNECHQHFPHNTSIKHFPGIHNVETYITYKLPPLLLT